MRRITIPACLMIMLTLLAHADGRDDYKRAMRNGAKAKLTVHVVDDNGHSISNATCHVGFADIATIIEEDVGHSDANGLYVAEGIAKDEIGGWVEKKGYYRSHFKFQKGDPPGMIDYGGDSSEAYYASKVRNGRWLPWNPTIPVVLRDIRNPIPMYVTNIYKHSIPSETPMGFDCVNQDWVAPHGKGVVTDFLVTFSPVGASEYDGACRIVLSSTDKEGGFIPKQKKSYSEFVSEYEAPVEGYSEVNIVRETKMKFYERNPSDLSEDEYLIFKSRIVRDKAGVIVSAHYGKIYGKMDYVFSRNKACGALGFTYYFNPKPNDPNLEFDGKHNLFLPQYDTSNHAP